MPCLNGHYRNYRIKVLNKIYGHIKVSIYIYAVLKHMFKKPPDNRVLLKCLTLIVSPIIFITIWTLRCIKALATLLITCHEGRDFVRLLDGIETIFLLQESSKSRAIITTLFLLECNNMTGLDVRDICRREITRIFTQDKFAKLRYTIARNYGYFYFQKSKMAVGSHFRDIPVVDTDDGKMNETKERFMDEEQLREYISAICNEPMPCDGRGLWEAHFGTRKLCLSLAREHNVYPLVLRFHHVLGDAVSLFNMFTADFQNSSANPRKHEYEASPMLRALDAIYTQNPSVIVIGTYPQDKNILCRTNGKKHVVWLSEDKPEILNLLKSIRQKMKDLTVVNIMVTCFLESLDAHFKRAQDGGVLPKSMFTVLPIMPPGFDFSSYGRNCNYVMNNQISLMFMRVPGNVEGADRRSAMFKRLELIKQKYDVLKNKSLDFIFNRWVAKVVITNLPHFLSKRIISIYRVSLMVSNIPGCESLEFFGGMKVKDFVIIDPNISSSAISLMIASYEKRLNFAFTIDKEVVQEVDDVKRIATDFLHNLQSLNEITNNYN